MGECCRQVGGNPAWRKGIDANTIAGPGDRQRPRELGHAALDEATREQYLVQLTLEPVTHLTCTTLQALRNELTLTRERGYAIDDEENELGIICFGQAVLGADGRVEGAISVSVPRYRLPDNGHQRILECICSLCSDAGLV